MSLNLSSFYKLNISVGMLGVISFIITAVSVRPDFIMKRDDDNKLTDEIDIPKLMLYGAASGGALYGITGLFLNFTLDDEDRLDESAHTVVATATAFVITYVAQKAAGRMTNVATISTIVALASGIVDNWLYRKYTATRPKCPVTEFDARESLERVVEASDEAAQLLQEQEDKIAAMISQTELSRQLVGRLTGDILTGLQQTMSSLSPEQMEELRTMNYNDDTLYKAIERTKLENINGELLDELNQVVGTILTSGKVGRLPIETVTTKDSQAFVRLLDPLKNFAQGPDEKSLLSKLGINDNAPRELRTNVERNFRTDAETAKNILKTISANNQTIKDLTTLINKAPRLTDSK